MQAELVILGEGSRRRELEGQAAALGVADSVLMPGFRENPYPWMATADVFVCSSRSEGMSTVVTEALALGLPVLAVECSGVREQLAWEGSGALWKIMMSAGPAAWRISFPAGNPVKIGGKGGPGRRCGCL